MSTVQQDSVFTDDGFIQFFGVRAKAVNPEEEGLRPHWLWSNSPTVPPYTQQAQSVIGYVKSVLQHAGKSARRDQAARLQLGPAHAMIFCLEGGIPRERLEHAVIGDGYIDIPDVVIGSWQLTLRIVRNGPNLQVTDADGNKI